VPADLSHLGLLVATGADSARFLQSRLTADLVALDAG
jgi:folate-binding Fe-S cluster repair protein YgfZ